MTEINYFKELSRIDCSGKIEKKGKFSYLSWAHAVETLGQHHPTATWHVHRFDGLPYLKTEVGFFVEVSVTVGDVTKSQIHPVLDNNNKPIPSPTCFQINTSIQRCLAKAIALHGLGLSIFYGEDILPEVIEERKRTQQEEAAQAFSAQIGQQTTLEGLRQLWMKIPADVKPLLEQTKESAKARIQQKEVA